MLNFKIRYGVLLDYEYSLDSGSYGKLRWEKFQNKLWGFVWGKLRRLGLGIMRNDWPLFRAKQFLGGKGAKVSGERG